MSNLKKILVAIDNGPFSEKITEKAMQFGNKDNLEIALVSVINPTANEVGTGITPKNLANMVKSEYEKKHQELIQKMLKDYKVSSFIKEGESSEEILEFADEWNADVIVIGTHGRTGLLHLLMGSVAEKVIKNSTKPLLVIPSK